MGSQDKTVFSVAEVAEYLNVPLSTLYKLTREGAIPGKKLGKQWRFSKLAIDRWLECASPIDQIEATSSDEAKKE